MKLFLLTVLAFGTGLSSIGQPERNNWLFGINQGLTFNGSNPSLLPNSSLKTFLGATSISDSNGVLLFYTNGGTVYNRKHVVMQGSYPSDVISSTDVISVPSSSFEDTYLVFSTDHNNLQFTTLHAKVDGPYLGEVMSSKGWYAVGMLDAITAVKNCSEGGYWLITVDGNRNGLGIWKVDGSDDKMGEIYQFHPLPTSPGNLIWELITSNDGSQILLVGTEGMFLIDFDTNCGKVSSIQDISAISPYDLLNASGACYSPNGEYLYFTFSQGGFPGFSKLVQVSAKDPLNKNFWSEIDFPVYGVKGLQNGPDGKMYIATYAYKDDKVGVHRLEKPNLKLKDAELTERIVELNSDATTSPYFPNYMNDRRVCSVGKKPSFEKNRFCVDDSIKLKLKGVSSYDSLFLIHENTGKVYDLRVEKSIEVGKLQVGNHEFLVTWSNCHARGKDSIPISVFAKPKVDIEDIELCFGDSTQLNTVDGDSTFMKEWQNDEWVAINKAQLGRDGKYKITVFENGCSSEDEFSVEVRDPLHTKLNNGFYVFCEQAQNVVSLSPGKGFKSYKWYPTNDTTEWIEVKRSDDYYVVVQDSRGCLGRGDAKVISDCTPDVHIPNAFSPNGDGVNDIFKLDGRFYEVEQVRIFDRWGECLYATENQPLHWDGTRKGEVLPVGTYFALITYSSQFGDEQVNYQGVVHLLK